MKLASKFSAVEVMRIRFTKHALSRMKEYDIPESEVLAAIVQPDKVV